MKKDYFEEKKKKQEQKIKVLINKPAFQKDIQEFRKFWKIPPEGIKNEVESQNWNMRLDVDTVNYYIKNWPMERKEIMRLRRQKKFEEAEDIRERISVNAPFNILKSNIWSVIKVYEISPRWYNGIRRYILFNDFGKIDDTLGMKINMNWDYGILKISLEIERDTVIDDLKHSLSWVKKTYGEKIYKFHEIPNFDRDKRAYELQLEGNSFDKIGKIISVEFKNGGLDNNQINIAIKRYKKRFNIS
jgi:hypothetical protein